jgi:hypothetical protein
MGLHRKMFTGVVLAAFAVPALLAQTPSPTAAAGSGGLNTGRGRGAPPPSGPAPKLANGQPDFSGVWQGGGPVGDLAQGMPKGEEIPLNEEGKRVMAARQSKDDPEANCLPTGVPRTAPYPWRLLQTPTHVFILFEGNIHSYRQIFVDGRKHPDDPDPTWYGHSVGHYEGDTLVVDTVGIKVMPWTTADRFGTPQSDMMHVTERYRLIGANEAKDALMQQEKRDGCVCGGEGSSAFVRPNAAALVDDMYDKGLRVEVRIEDPKVFTTPWTGNVTYMHVRRGWAETVCAENNTDVLHRGFEHVPTATQADF